MVQSGPGAVTGGPERARRGVLGVLERARRGILGVLERVRCCIWWSMSGPGAASGGPGGVPGWYREEECTRGVPGPGSVPPWVHQSSQHRSWTYRLVSTAVQGAQQ